MEGIEASRGVRISGHRVNGNRGCRDRTIEWAIAEPSSERRGLEVVGYDGIDAV